MIIKKKDLLRISRSAYSSELHLLGCEYSSRCEKCQKPVIYQGYDVLIDREVGGKHWLNITFHCDPCEYQWEVEKRIKVDIDVSFC